MEKEVECSPFAGDILGVADGAVRFVLDRAVILDVTNSPVGGILDGPIVLDMTDGAVTLVLHVAVVPQVADGPVGSVLFFSQTVKIAKIELPHKLIDCMPTEFCV